jgi:predicted esterase
MRESEGQVSSLVTRRHFGKALGGAFASFVVGSACARGSASPEVADGRLTVRPRPNVVTSAKGEVRLGLGSKRDAILHMPPAAASGPVPLLILFHGAGSSGEIQLRRMGSVPDEAGVAVLAPDSRGPTWDAIRGGFGPDVDFLNEALAHVFDTVNVDPARLTIGGFSDGATYALSLGLINGDLFPRVAAFSAGFVVAGTPHGKPKFFISHGTSDEILPIEQCGRRIASELKQRGYDVTYREFPGKHEIPPDVARDGLRWVAGTAS